MSDKSKDNFPRVLIYGEVFKLNTGGGITLSNLFKNWPSENLAVISERTEEANGQICHKYYHLGQKEVFRQFPLSIIYGTALSGEKNISSKSVVLKEPHLTILAALRSRLSFLSNFGRSGVMAFLHRIGVYHSMTTIKMSDELKTFINDFNPDVLYCQAFSLQAISLIIKLKIYTKKPLVIHIMDDFPNIIVKRGFMNGYWKRKVHSSFKKLISISNVRLSISDSMSREFKQRYGYDFIAFRNPVDLDFWGLQLKNSYQNRDQFVILYAGRLGPGTDKTLIQIGKAIDLLNQKCNFNVLLLIQASSCTNWMNGIKSIKYQSLIPYDCLPSLFSSVDLLLLPYDFKGVSSQYYRYSMPTKLSEYMASGTPIFVVAPSDTALYEYVYTKQVGFTSNTDDLDSLSSLIEEIYTDYAKRKFYANRAIEVVMGDSDSKLIRESFRKVLLSCCE
jgi:glycosyltransferase involved in cell wall biosynthesis